MRNLNLKVIIFTLCLIAFANISSAFKSRFSLDGFDLENETKVEYANYMILCHNTLIVDKPYSFFVTLLGNKNLFLSSIQANITRNKNEKVNESLIYQKTWKAFEDSILLRSKTIVLDNIEIDPSFSYSLSVVTTDNKGKVYTNSTSLNLQTLKPITFIQTDKAIYKPGHLVKFRIFSVTDKLLPVYQNYTVSIKDGSGNLVDKQYHVAKKFEPVKQKEGNKNFFKIALAGMKNVIEEEIGVFLDTRVENPVSKKNPVPQQEETQSVSEAVMEGSFLLSDKPVMGEWRIIVEAASGTKQKTFTVAKYVLPKFDVEMELPTFVHLNDSEFTINVIPKYTYAKEVYGTVSLEVNIGDNCQPRQTWCKPRDFSHKWRLTKNVESKSDDFSFKISLDDWRKLMQERKTSLPNYMSQVSVYVLATFTERFTEISKNVSNTMYIYKNKYNIEFSHPTIDFFLPGTRIPLEIKVTRPNQTPYTEAFLKKVQVVMKYKRRGKPMETMVYNDGFSGLDANTMSPVARIDALVPATADFTQIQIEARIDGDGENKFIQTSVEPFVSVSDHFVKVSLKLKGPEQSLSLSVKKSKGLGFIYIFFINQNQIIKAEEFAFTKMETTKELTVSDILKGLGLFQLFPNLRVVVVGITEDGEFIAAADEIDLSSQLPSISIDSDVSGIAEVGQNVSLSILSTPKSLLYLLGIDHSVNLMKTGNDVTTQDVTSQFKMMGTFSRRWWGNSAVTTEKILQDSNLNLLTDGFYMKNFYDNTPRMMGRVESMKAGPVLMSMESADGAPPAPGNSAKPREFFPESFIFATVNTEDGRANYKFTIPDTITSWDISAFGLSNSWPLQTMNKAYNIVSMKKFFVEPVLPYSLIRTEEFILKVVVFNYDKTSKKVRVSVPAPESQFTSSPLYGQDIEKATNCVLLDIGAQGSALALFRIKPLVMPSIRLTIKSSALDSSVGDTVIRSIPVVPEGKTVYKTSSVVLKLDKGRSNAIINQTMKPEFPIAEGRTPSGQLFVAGSEDTRIQVVGDVMGSAMQNLASLLRMPYGCGEQNMLNFAPAVFVNSYLKSVGELTPAIAEKTVLIMKTGYQRELTYKRRDGSYSAFGDNDNAGSTWLTAFVLKIYAMASPYITIDPEALTSQSVVFLLGHQATNGAFYEPPEGRVIHKGLQGGVGSATVAMTAYICTSLIEIKTATEVNVHFQTTLWKELNVEQKLRKSLIFLVEAFKKDGETKLSPLDLALTSYAFELAFSKGFYGFIDEKERESDPTMTDSMRDKVWNALTKDGVSYLKQKDSDDKGSVEATSYLLLSAVLREDMNSAVVLLKWLTSQQNSQGGFDQTQETVVGLHALSNVARMLQLNGPPTNAVVRTQWGTTPEKSANFEITPDNRQVLFSHLIGQGNAARTNDIMFGGQGTGVVLLSLAWQYNIIEAKDKYLTVAGQSQNNINLRLETTPEPIKDPNSFSYGICTNASNGEGMYIIQVDNPSGFEIASYRGNGPNGLISGLQYVETEAKQIIFYMEQLREFEVCIKLFWKRQFAVMKQMPQKISVQSYYQTELQNVAFYLYPGLNELSECEVCPECGVCPV